MYGAIEAGGTKFVLGLVNEAGQILERKRIPTTDPAETLSASIAWLKQKSPLKAVGVASFGPCDIEAGTLLETPKAGWSQVSITQPIASALQCPVAFDTDVNGAALSELKFGAGQNHASLAYVTVGTGIGVGLAFDGQTWSLGGRHPELGHIQVKRHKDDAAFKGVCPFHGDCLEGLASGPAILARWGADLSALGAGSQALEIIGYYLGQLVTTIRAGLMPEIIVLGGGVMKAPGLLEAVRRASEQLNGGYWPKAGSDAVVLPHLEDNAGLMGAYLLAKNKFG